MSVSPQYEEYAASACVRGLRAQSIVECRLADWAENHVLAVWPRVVPSSAEVLSGEVRYGGTLYFSLAARTPDGSVVGAERGAEFTHRAECADAAPAQQAALSLAVEKVELRRDGRTLVLSAIVSAEISRLVPGQLRLLTGGEGVACDLVPVRLSRAAFCAGTAEIEEEFDTDYVGDVLLHSEQVCLTRVVAADGLVEVSGEIAVGVLSKREGESDVVAYERTVPFRAEIPCDEAAPGAACDASAALSSVRLSAACDEDKNRCRLLAELSLAVNVRLWRGEEVLAAQDAFCPGRACTLHRETVRAQEPLCAFTVSERAAGTAALDGPVGPAAALQAASLCRVEAAAEVREGEVIVEGVLSATVFFKEENAAQSVRASLPFTFPVRCDRARAGDVAEVHALACGVSCRGRREGELDCEGTVKLFIALRGESEQRFVCAVEAGEASPLPAAVSIHFPAAGDTLWDTAKKLGRAPEDVRRENPDLTFPLTGKERIVVYSPRPLGA